MDEIDDFEALIAREYPRLIRLCVALTGSPAAAEDLAQEAMLEAWRVRDRLSNPAGMSAWLSAIARNVCLRWRRAQGRETQLLTSSPLVSLDDVEIAGDVDLEIEVERRGLTDLLDRALGRLPPSARTVLTDHYAGDLTVQEMAARQGKSEGAITQRLHRGRQALKRVLTTDLRSEAAVYGLLEGVTVQWQETRIWCCYCGQAKLQIQCDPATCSFAARCAVCSVQWTDHTAGHLDEVKGPWRTMLRMTREAHRYYRGALGNGGAWCACCGRHADLHLAIPPEDCGRGVRLRCGTCGAVSYQPSIGLVLTLPEVEILWRKHRRIRVARESEVEYLGRPAVVTSLETVGNASILDVVSDRDTFQVLEIRGAPAEERKGTCPK